MKRITNMFAQSKVMRFATFVFTTWLLASCTSSSTFHPQQALNFLYAYMPLPDSVDYPRDFWEENTRISLLAREEMPWGKSVPEREWKHFVLPVRVNNENLDSARTVFYKALRERVKHLSMYDAVLEVNHWCHEHVTYQPSDSRTSAPLATLQSAIGRCGEESTFTVAALRAVGIPARQVYTPRWAHTDNNHAWVEAWVDGKWYFLGACEPEPVLNLGWFNAPASRGLLMHTKVFGAYEGPEEVMSRTACYTEINVTENYAPVSPLQVKVLNSDGTPAAEARVDYRVYNYAEFYSLVSKYTNSQGFSSLSCGLGDLLVWAAKDGHFGFAKASVGKDSLLTITLDKTTQYTGTFDLDIIPPSERNNLPYVTEEQRQQNKLRFQYEDSLRQAYMDSAFYHPTEAQPETFLTHARANHRTISQFLQQHPTAEATQMLQTLRSKDFRDISLHTLENHFMHLPKGKDGRAITHPYVAGLRIANEMITPWRETLQKAFYAKDIQFLIQWTRDSITIDETRNPQHLCMSPLGVYTHRITDSHSRDLFFVAAARSMGIPARIHEASGKVQWADNNLTWNDIEWHTASSAMPPTGIVLLTEGTPRPEYATHFTFSCITEDCQLQLQDYEMNPSQVQRFFEGGLSMNAGAYLLTTGTRMANGGVLAHMQFFNLSQDEHVTLTPLLRTDTAQVLVRGQFDSELRYLPMNEEMPRSILSTTGRGYFVVGFLNPGDEPTNHALRDLASVSKKLEQWGRPIVLLTKQDVNLSAYLSRPEFQGLPSTVSFGKIESQVIDQVFANSRIPLGKELPVFFIADTFNRVVWHSQGYTIGVGEQILNIASKL